MGNLLGAPVTDKETHVGETMEGGGSPRLKYGLSSMQGWRVHMEDAHIAEGSLYALKFNSEGDIVSENNNNNNNAPPPPQKISLPGHSLFAVFDGHGGTFSAEYAGRNFLRVLSKQPKWLEYAQSLGDASITKQQRIAILEQALQQAFVETDYEIGLAIRGNPVPDANQKYHVDSDGNDGNTSTTTTNQDNNSDNNNNNAGTTMRDAASKVAENHAAALDDDGDSGTTACMVMITPDAYVCANAGDSRAVFSRRNPSANDSSTPLHLRRQAVALSYDHKPDDEQEERRIRAAGGYVAGGRVEGDLAVSRGLGDFRFKNMQIVLQNVNLEETETNNNNTSDVFGPGDQKVSPIPDILVQSRNPTEDEFVIVACDGIWDVQSNQDCVQEVSQIYAEGETDVGLICEEVSERQ